MGFGECGRERLAGGGPAPFNWRRGRKGARGGGSGPLGLGGERRGGPDGAGATCGGPGGQQRRWGSGRRGCGRGGDVLWSGGVR
jgi:hypothetical protein